MTPESRNDWSEYEKLVIYRLDNLDKSVSNMREDIITLKVKSGMWGAIGGSVAGIVAAALAALWPSNK